MAWSKEDLNDVKVNSWKEALVTTSKQLLALGLPVAKLPMKSAATVDAPAIAGKSPAKLNDEVAIETHGSSEQIRSWISAAIEALELKDENDQPIVITLQIETRAGVVHALPETAG